MSTSTAWRAAVTLIWLACSDDNCPALGAVPVRGGSAAERSLVSSELARLGSDVVAPVCVARVTIGGWARILHQGGSYSTVTRQISLAPSVVETDLVTPLRHEVCHAVDFQNNIVEDTGKSAFRMVDALTGEDLERPGHEPFAVLCSYGAEALEPLRGRCSLDPDLTGIRAIREQVFGFADDGSTVDRLGEAVTLEEGGLDLEPDETVVGAVFRETQSGNLSLDVTMESPGHVRVRFLTVDPTTGETMPLEDIGDVEVVEPAYRPPPPWRTIDLAGRADGAAYAWAELDVGHGVVGRTLRGDGVRWDLLDGYCTTDQSLFQLGGSAWTGSFGGAGGVSWRVWEPGEQ